MIAACSLHSLYGEKENQQMQIRGKIKLKRLLEMYKLPLSSIFIPVVVFIFAYIKCPWLAFYLLKIWLHLPSEIELQALAV